MTKGKNELYEKVFKIACSNRILSFNDPAINTLFNAIKKALDNDIISRIECLDRNKAIMIVCGDNHLTKGIISYIWYTHPPKLIKSGIGYNARRVSLRHKDYLRWTETQVMSDLTDWGISFHEVVLGSFRYEWDYIQFFQNLKGAYWKALKYLLDKTKTYKDILLEKHKQELQIIEQNYKQFPQIDYKKCLEEAKNNILENGRMLIVSTDKVGTLPKNLSEQFEIVEPNLETEKQIINKDTSSNIIPFSTPPGSNWSDLKMTIIGYEKVKLKVKGETTTTNYEKMGFEDRRKGKPNDAWKRLTEFAYNNGMLTNFSSTKKNKIEKDVQDIRNILSKRFKIVGKPIPDYIKGEGYKTAFNISYQEEKEQKSKELSNSDDNKDDMIF